MALHELEHLLDLERKPSQLGTPKGVDPEFI